MENTWYFAPQNNTDRDQDSLCSLARRLKLLMTEENTFKCKLPDFKRITPENMDIVWGFLRHESGRTTDFSYGGILMWIDYFNYEYSIYKDTLFIKGVVENDIGKPAFSLPIGKMPLDESVPLLKEYCDAKGIQLEFSAVPEYALGGMKSLHPLIIEELSDWGDYLYASDSLSTLTGKKMSKKRNHVHQFESHYPDGRFEFMTSDNAYLAMEFMNIFDSEGDPTDMAAIERKLSRNMIRHIINGDKNLTGMLLFAEGKVCAFTIGDVKGDTLFIHVEKATRKIVGSYEMINYVFAREMCAANPDIRFINREDDAGDIGLRMAKESYHPVEILKKYNITF